MQMKRLEERLERPIFARDGRASKLTDDGQRLLDYARRIVKLNVETIAAFSDAELSGRVRLGVPDDYADRYLPEIMARFSRAYPGVELTVICEPSVDLLERIDANEIDLAIVTNCESKRASETFRRERLCWVTSNRHRRIWRSACRWRSAARPVAGAAPPSSGWRRSAGPTAFSIRARMPARSPPPCSQVSPCRYCRSPGLRPGMRVLSAADGFPELPSCHIGLVRNSHEGSPLADALGRAHRLLARQLVGRGGGGVMLVMAGLVPVMTV